MRFQQIRSYVAAGLMMAFLAGCGGGGATDGPKLEKVTGKVTLSGAPVEGAVVTFAPKGQGQRTATARTDASGNFDMTTITAGDGAVKGEYTVVIVKQEQLATVATPDSSDPNYGKSSAYPGAGSKTKFLTPEKYASPGTSGLTASVKEGKNEINFDLKP